MNNLANGAVPNEQVAGWQQDLANSQMSDAAGLFGSMVQDGMSMFGQNPMMNIMGSMLGLSMQMETPDALSNFFERHLEQPEPEPSPYEARIQQLMDNRGWSREEAVANQTGALEKGTDYNNDGAVTNDEWRKYKNPQQGGAVPGQYVPGRYRGMR